MSYRFVATWTMLAVLTVLCAFVLRVVYEHSVVSTAQAQPANLTEVSVTRVVDGDTIEVSPQVEGTADVRLIGIDTPETFGETEPYGPQATAFTTRRLEGKRVGLEFDEDRTDQYDRALAYVWVGNELFNETLVRQGYARVSTFEPNVKYEDRFTAAEQQAKAEGLGIWGLNPEQTTPERTTPERTTPQPNSQPNPRPESNPRPGDKKRLTDTSGPVRLDEPLPLQIDGTCMRTLVKRDGACYPR